MWIRTLPGALPGECFIHFLLFLCSDFAIMSTAELPLSGEDQPTLKKGKCTEGLMHEGKHL
ncbi:hypothetical protein DXC92_06545 [Clostridiales bacterium TF09-2AC]|nr:hypothetical protein DXC92_06545 [Clostridiales bacterium TF09-2AC]